MKKAIQLAALAAFAAAISAGCGGGNGGGESTLASDAPADVPDDVKLSWPAMYGYLLASLGSEPEQGEPARLPGEDGPVSDVVEPETKP